MSLEEKAGERSLGAGHGDVAMRGGRQFRPRLFRAWTCKGFCKPNRVLSFPLGFHPFFCLLRFSVFLREISSQALSYCGSYRRWSRADVEMISIAWLCHATVSHSVRYAVLAMRRRMRHSMEPPSVVVRIARIGLGRPALHPATRGDAHVT